MPVIEVSEMPVLVVKLVGCVPIHPQPFLFIADYLKVPNSLFACSFGADA